MSSLWRRDFSADGSHATESHGVRSVSGIARHPLWHHVSMHCQRSSRSPRMDIAWHGLEGFLFRLGFLARTPWGHSQALDSMCLGGPRILSSLLCGLEKSAQAMSI